VRCLLSFIICSEGIAGSGKTTQTKLLTNYLKNVKGKDVFISAAYEGERRKAVSDFMNTSGIKPDQNAVMFLFQALHAAQYHEVNKAIGIGKIVRRRTLPEDIDIDKFKYYSIRE